MPIFYHYNADHITVEGQTYPHRDRLKALGARFIGDRKVWQLRNDPAVLDSVKNLCLQVGGGALQGSEPSLVLQPPPQATPASSAGLEEKLSDSLSVSQLMLLINGAIAEKFPTAVWIVGEVQGLSTRGAGTYFTLAEQDQTQRTSAAATVNAVIWRAAFKSLEKRYGAQFTEVLQEGLQIRCLCQVSIYAGRGQISLTVMDIDPSFTKGALALAREKLLKELRAKGLDRANKQRYLTPIPLRIGLISADGSRAQGDFLHQLEAGAYPGEIVFVSMAMQGTKVAGMIAQALAALVARECDLIVLTRGGGSAADLQAFDSPEVAYAIAACPLPIIAAIGHHDDFCVAEEIAYQRRKTPTAAADFILECFYQLNQRLQQIGLGMGELLNRALIRVGQQQARYGDRLYHAACQALARKHEQLLRLMPRIDQQVAAQLHKHTLAIEALAQRLVTRDPRPWLQQGWTRLQGKKGPIKNLADIAVGEEVRARLIDGNLVLTVHDKKHNSSN